MLVGELIRPMLSAYNVCFIYENAFLNVFFLNLDANTMNPAQTSPEGGKV